MAEALREGRKRRVARSDINATETATFLVAAWEGYVVLPLELRIRALKPSVSGMEAEYQRLPADTVVYLTLNTETYPRYRVTGGGIVVN
jgi:hypothetical protein